jgi:hypothetical protein
MSKALQCPACRNKHALELLPATPTFRCHRCGQVLKVPQLVLDRAVRSAQVEGGVAAAEPVDDASYGAPEVEPTFRRESPRSAAVALMPERVPNRLSWWIRALIWLLVFPAAGYLCLTVGGAFGWWGETRRAGLANIVTTALDKGVGGMGMLLIFAVVWALTASMLVTALVNGSTAWKSRRMGKRIRAGSQVESRRVAQDHSNPPTPESSAPQAVTLKRPDPVSVPVPDAATPSEIQEWELPRRKR